MPLQVKCPNPACRGVGVIDDKVVGTDTRCPSCGKTFHVAAPPTVAPRPAPSTILPVAAAKQTQDGGASPAASAKPPAASGSSKRIGRFEVRARLGAGAFGVVYRAFDPSLQREVALKVLHPEMLNHPDRVARFQREARSVAQLRHANIVPVFDIGQDGGQYFIASAYIPGQTLHDALDKKPMPFQRAARIVRDLADAVGYAHQQGVVHRDLKPANILLDEKDSPQLVDFGLSARQEETTQEKANRLTRLGAVLGTPAYIAPEQAGGQTGEVQPAADQYSLGIILYELLCGRPPFEGPPDLVLYNVLNKEPATPCSVNASVPRELERICLKAMARRPEDRYADCQALADALRRWLEGNATPARAALLDAKTILAPKKDAPPDVLGQADARDVAKTILAPKKDAPPIHAIRNEAKTILAPRKDVAPVRAPKKEREEPRRAWLMWTTLAAVGCLLVAVVAGLGGAGIWWMTHKKSTAERVAAAPGGKEQPQKGEGEASNRPQQPDQTAAELQAKLKEEEAERQRLLDEEEVERKRRIEKKKAAEQQRMADEEEAERKRKADEEAAKQRAAQEKIAPDAEEQRKMENLVGKQRATTFKNNGGNYESAAAIERGLEWLAMHQSSDGHWSMTEFHLQGRDAAWPNGKVVGNCGCKPDGGNAGNDIAGTAFGLLPFLGAGQTHIPKNDANRKVDYSKNVEAGLRYLMRRQDKEGNFGGGMYSHGVATIAMCEAYGLTNDPTVKMAAQRAINFIIEAQDPKGGGWRYTPKMNPGDLSVSSWELTALKSGERAGLTVPKGTLKRADEFWLSCEVREKNDDPKVRDKLSGFGYMPGSKAPAPAMTAVGLLGLIYKGTPPANRDLLDGIDYLKKYPPGRTGPYYEYYATQVMHHLGGESWQFWNLGPDGKSGIRDTLINKQDMGQDPKHVHQLGSWDGTNASGGGRLMATSLNLLSLEAPYELLPMYRREKEK